VLHSLVPKEEQDQAMAPALAGHCKIILSTNIAESSITIPDVRVVIDSGLHRGIFYDDKRRMPSLLCTWCCDLVILCGGNPHVCHHKH
jgi:HrpA-like RNA helicase